MALSSQTIFYPLAQIYWPDDGALNVKDAHGQRLAIFPIRLLRTGLVDRYGFVERMMRLLFACHGTLASPDGKRLLSEDKVEPGEAILLQSEDTEQQTVYPLKGPRFKYKYRAHTESDNASTMSDSKRSSANQNRFRESLLARDSYCLLSDTDFASCTASHILPQSRPEYYTEVLGFDPGYLFLASYGLLLRDDLHHSFDRGEWALFPLDDDVLVVHVFAPTSTSLRAFQGKTLSRDRFRAPRDRHPDRRLLMFHYQQCAIKHFRGYSAGI